MNLERAGHVFHTISPQYNDRVFSSVLVGAFTGLSLIVAIGAQNAFVLQQGIRRQHVLPVVLMCGLTDAVLETAGVAGIGFVVERAPIVLEVVRWGGVAFLVWYAWFSLRRALKPGVLIAEGEAAPSLGKTLLACAAITYLNPHVYLDTMVLMGSIGNAEGDPEKWWFALGGGIASVLWFFMLGYGARFLTKFFASPRSWQILDTLVGVTMLVIATKLVLDGVG